MKTQNGSKTQKPTPTTQTTSQSATLPPASTLQATPAAQRAAIFKPQTFDMTQVQAIVTQALSSVGQISTEIPGLTDLSAGDKQGMLKPRTGSEQYIQEMIVAIQNYPALFVADFDATAMQETLDYLALVHTLELATAALSKRMGDTWYARMSGLWKQSLDVYAVLQRAEPANAALVTLLAPMTAYLARGGKVIEVIKAPKVKKTRGAKAKVGKAPAAGGAASSGTATEGSSPAAPAGSSAPATGTTPATGGSSSNGPTPSGTTAGGVPIYTPGK